MRVSVPPKLRLRTFITRRKNDGALERLTCTVTFMHEPKTNEQRQEVERLIQLLEEGGTLERRIGLMCGNYGDDSPPGQVH